MKDSITWLGALLVFLAPQIAFCDHRILLTFDDGPSVEAVRGLETSSTEHVLKVLQQEGIRAAFFVLTTADRFLGHDHPKAETASGFASIRHEIRDGHLIACHWGGDYHYQTLLHTSRLGLPAYDSDGDGVVDRVTEPGNALESDLLQCIGRVRQAQVAEGETAHSPEFVRPPLWKYLKEAPTAGAQPLDARPTYRALGLKMILTDAKLSDGGYRFAGWPLPGRMNHQIVDAIRAGESDIIVTMHDSNPATAKNLSRIIHDLRAALAGAGLVDGRDWHFTRDRDEVREVLQAKRHFRAEVSGADGNAEGF